MIYLGLIGALEKLNGYVSNNVSSWKRATSFMSSNNIINNGISARVEEILNSHSFDELPEITLALIRRHDIENEFHCQKVKCGKSCIFTPKHCPNEGCHEIYPIKWESKHDAECPFKVIECIRKCGDTFQRRLTDTHLHSICPLRPVDCPFNEFGCIVGKLYV